jgi:hypothetical protein
MVKHCASFLQTPHRPDAEQNLPTVLPAHSASPVHPPQVPALRLQMGISAVQSRDDVHSTQRPTRAAAMELAVAHFWPLRQSLSAAQPRHVPLAASQKLRAGSGQAGFLLVACADSAGSQATHAPLDAHCAPVGLPTHSASAAQPSHWSAPPCPGSQTGAVELGAQPALVVPSHPKQEPPAQVSGEGQGWFASQVTQVLPAAQIGAGFLQPSLPLEESQARHSLSTQMVPVAQSALPTHCTQRYWGGFVPVIGAQLGALPEQAGPPPQLHALPAHISPLTPQLCPSQVAQPLLATV